MIERVKESYAKKKYAYISAIAYFIFFSIIIAFFSNSMLGFILGTVMFLIMAVLMVLSGFYFYIIPLPIIFITKWNFLDENLTFGKKALYLIFIILFALCGFFTLDIH